MNTEIEVSIIVPSYNSAWSIRQCLSSLLGQRTNTTFEVIVADSSKDETPEIIRKEFPSVKLVHFEEQTFPGKARNAGAAHAKGDILAFFDSDCRAHPRWLDNCLALAREKGGAVGGEIINGEPFSLIGTADHVLTFNEFVPGTSAKEMGSIPSCNFVLSKKLFDSTEGFPEDMITGEDTVFNYFLTKKAKIHFDPKIKVKHYGRTTFARFFRHHYNFGVHSVIARRRTKLSGQFLLRHPYLAFLLPFARSAKISSRLLTSNLRAFGLFMATFPIIFLGLVVWSYGWFKEVRKKN